MKFFTGLSLPPTSPPPNLPTELVFVVKNNTRRVVNAILYDPANLFPEKKKIEGVHILRPDNILSELIHKYKAIKIGEVHIATTAAAQRRKHLAITQVDFMGKTSRLPIKFHVGGKMVSSPPEWHHCGVRDYSDNRPLFTISNPQSAINMLVSPKSELRLTLKIHSIATHSILPSDFAIKTLGL